MKKLNEEISGTWTGGNYDGEHGGCSSKPAETKAP